MTYFVCQIPHLRPATVWAADSEQEIIDAIVGDSDNAFTDAFSAAQYDMRDAYVTTDPLDLYHWASLDQNARATFAASAVLANRDVRRAVESLAEIDDEPLDTDATIYRSSAGRFLWGGFTWNEDESEWRVGNGPWNEAPDLVAAICAASLEAALATQVEQQDA